MEIKYRLNKRTTDTVEKNGVTYLEYNIFKDFSIKTAVSTRLGGVSKGYVGTMNMSTSRGDDPLCVQNNHKLFADAVGYHGERLVMSDQIHETFILRVNEEDAGGMVIKRGVDGLMTNVKKLPLMTFYADCTPLMFYDKENEVIAMAHSGWRGTVEQIGKICIERMTEEYGTRPENTYVAIGPNICQDCYEVDEPLLKAFKESFGSAAFEWFKPSAREDHYLLDLSKACKYTLMQTGILEEHIAEPDLCTCCNPEFLFSHRASGAKRGNLSVVMEIS